MKFEDFGVTEVLALLAMVGVGVAMIMGQVSGEVFSGVAVALVTAIGTMRRIKAGQKIKAQAGNATIETNGDGTPVT